MIHVKLVWSITSELNPQLATVWMNLCETPLLALHNVTAVKNLNSNLKNCPTALRHSLHGNNTMWFSVQFRFSPVSGTVAVRVVLPPHSSVWTCLVGFFWVIWFPSTSPKHTGRQIDDQQLHLDANECVNVYGFTGVPSRMCSHLTPSVKI